MTPTLTDAPANGADPMMQKLDQILSLLGDFSEGLEEITEKLNDLALTANEGFGYTEPES